MHHRMSALFRTLYKRYVVELKSETDSKVQFDGSADRRALVVVGTVLGSLIFMKYFGSAAHLDRWTYMLEAVGLSDFAESLQELMHNGAGARAARKTFWAVSRLFGYVFIPLLVVSLFLRGPGQLSFRELFGLERLNFKKHGGIYVAMLLIVAPFVVAASYSSAFQAKYPFYHLGPNESLWPWMVLWEIIYALQFFGLEVFYRGFMIHGLKERFGYGCIYMMMVPYMMIHFGKPLPECVGSIIAGFVLGTMSLKSGSIWGGVFLHVLVAWGMDFLSLFHKGQLWP